MRRPRSPWRGDPDTLRSVSAQRSHHRPRRSASCPSTTLTFPSLHVRAHSPLPPSTPSAPRRSRSTPPDVPRTSRMSRTLSQACESRTPNHRRRDVKATTDQGIQTEPVSTPVDAGTSTSWTAPAEAAVTPLPSIPDLAHVLRLDRYESRRCRLAQRHVAALHVVAARNARMIQAAPSVRRTLAECIRSEDKQSFTNLIDAFHDTAAVRGHVPTLPTDDDSVDAAYPGLPDRSWVDACLPNSRSALMDLLSKLGCDGNYVADRIAALTHHELLALLPEKGLSRSSDSVFGSTPRTGSRASRHMGYVVDSQSDSLSSSEYDSPLEALIHSVRGVSSRRLHEDATATGVWATVCARLIQEQKPGSERLIPAIVDKWASSSPWPGKIRLESWLFQTLQQGAFLLEQPAKQSFRVRVQGRQDPPAEDDVKRETFLSNAVTSLLELLGETNGPSVLPDGARLLCRAICQKLQGIPNQERTVPDFMLIRWLFSTFVPDVLTFPEGHVLLHDYYISDNARSRILREITSRCQKIVSEVIYPWKHLNPVSKETARLVHRVGQSLRSCPVDNTSFTQTHPNGNTNQKPKVKRDVFMVLSAADMKTVIDALYPPRRLSTMSADPLQSGLQSSASSISGFSLFQNIKSPEPLGWPAPLTMQDPTVLPSQQDYAVATPRTVLDFSKDALQVPVVEDHLRDVVSVIDELPPTAHPSWCVLVADATSGSLCTLTEELSPSGGPIPTSTEATTVQRRCGAVPTPGSMDDRLRSLIEELLVTEEVAFHNPTASMLSSSHEQAKELHHDVLQALRTKHMNAEERLDFVTAHAYFNKMQAFLELTHNGDDLEIVSKVWRDIANSSSTSLKRSLVTIETCQDWTRQADHHLVALGKDVGEQLTMASQLRDKMWYVADVRTSAAYEEVRSIAAALEIMGRSKRSSRNRTAPALRHWNSTRMTSTTLHLKTEAQILELLSASPHHGGPNKLSNDQSRIVSTWMEQNSVENLCRGEERLHKLCMEVRKAVDQVTAEQSPLMASSLLARDATQLNGDRRQATAHSHNGLSRGTGRFEVLKLHTNFPPSIDAVSSVSSHALSPQSSREHLENRSPTLTNKSSATFWSPVVSDAQSPSSATSIGSARTQGALIGLQAKAPRPPHHQGDSMVERLRQRLTSLLLSDLCWNLFNVGSETDLAFWTELGGELTAQYLRTISAGISEGASRLQAGPQFDFEAAFLKLFRSFSDTSNPFTKLGRLLDIDMLIGPYAASTSASGPELRSDSQSHSVSMQHHRPRSLSAADVKVQGFRRLFCNSSIRPKAIFRDLQFISALVPSSTLESTPQGKAFWNAAVAIVGLKQETRNIMVETADSIIAFHSNNRGHGRAPSSAQQQRDSATFTTPTRTPSAEDFSRYTMKDAASLLQIAAKEGDHAAQRELATIYLTDPDLLDHHIIAPFARPRDVFKEELESKWRKNNDSNRCDPVTMCVAHHWFTLSSRGGDVLAGKILLQREDMDKLPSKAV